MKRTVSLQLAPERLDGHDFGTGVRHLHHGFAAQHVAAEECVDADQAFVTDGGNFHHRAIRHHRRHRRDATVEKEHFSNRLIDRMKDLSDRGGNRLQVGSQTFEVCAGQAREQLVLRSILREADGSFSHVPASWAPDPKGRQ